MTRAKPDKPRHHGDLKKALVEAGIELLLQGGVSALTLRKCAARAGVSHAAPAHHFNGIKGLQTAIATVGFTEFTATMIRYRNAAPDDPFSRLAAIARGYLAFARDNEAMATLMFMKDQVFFDDPELQAASDAAYRVLAETCAPFEPGPGGPKATEVMIWSLVQGYASLTRTGQVDAAETPFEDFLPLLGLEPRQPVNDSAEPASEMR